MVDTLNQVVAIDPATQRVSARLNLPGRPSGAAIGPGGVIYVAAEDAAEVWVVEPGAGVVRSRIPVGSRPTGVALSADGGKAHVTNRGDGTVAVLDVPTRPVVATIQVGQDPVALAFAARASQSATPTLAATTAKPTPTPTLVPTPTPLPRDAPPPERLPPGTVKETFVPGAKFPAAMAFAPDGRLFYAELRTGKIRIVQNGVLLPDPFDQFAVAGQSETGLLGLVLDPNFAKSHYVYVFYTQVAGGRTQSGGSNGPNQLVRLTEVNGKGTNPLPILRDLPSGAVHNAGTLRFGPDGKLYVTIGEVGNGDNFQDLDTLAGKILRINPDGSIPDDNPFVGQSGKHPAIWVVGH